MSRYELGANRLHRVCFSLFVTLFAAYGGCAEPDQVVDGRALASGSVTLDGRPLPAGTVTFISPDGVRAATKIRGSGRYMTDRAAVGKNVVTIDTSSVQFGHPASFVPIPGKYRDPRTSGFVVDIKPGANTVDFALQK